MKEVYFYLDANQYFWKIFIDVPVLIQKKSYLCNVLCLSIDFL